MTNQNRQTESNYIIPRKTSDFELSSTQLRARPKIRQMLNRAFNGLVVCSTPLACVKLGLSTIRSQFVTTTSHACARTAPR